MRVIAMRKFETEGLFFFKDRKGLTLKWLPEGGSGEQEANDQER